MGKATYLASKTDLHTTQDVVYTAAIYMQR